MQADSIIQNCSILCEYTYTHIHIPHNWWHIIAQTRAIERSQFKSVSTSNANSLNISTFTLPTNTNHLQKVPLSLHTHQDPEDEIVTSISNQEWTKEKNVSSQQARGSSLFQLQHMWQRIHAYHTTHSIVMSLYIQSTCLHQLAPACTNLRNKLKTSTARNTTTREPTRISISPNSMFKCRHLRENVLLSIDTISTKITRHQKTNTLLRCPTKCTQQGHCSPTIWKRT